MPRGSTARPSTHTTASPLDVLTDIKRDFASQLADSLDAVRDKSSPRDYLVRICEFIYTYRELELIILSNSNDDEVLEAALGSSSQIWGTANPFMHMHDMDEESRSLVFAFYYHGIFRVIGEWIRRDIRKTPEEVAEILYRILFED